MWVRASINLSISVLISVELSDKLRQLNRFTVMQPLISGKNIIYFISRYNNIQYIRQYIVSYLNNDIKSL